MKTIDFLYKNIIRQIAFKFDAEDVHNLAISGLKLVSKFDFLKKIIEKKFQLNQPLKLNGLNFRNPLGLAAGFDKNAEVYDVIASLGFGFVEVGSVTLKPQKGNPGPRLWRIPSEKAIVNHFGLNNFGAVEFLKNIERKGKPKIPLGINISKNNDCDFNNAHKNISECFKILKDCGDFFVINISCPNVECFSGNLRDYAERILKSVKEMDLSKIIFIKISPDISDNDITEITELCENYRTGIVATNTTKNRKLLITSDFDDREGGISGKPLSQKSLDVLKKIREKSRDVPVISCGGIFNHEDIKIRKEAGAQLFEIYTSFIYEGPSVVDNLLS